MVSLPKISVQCYAYSSSFPEEKENRFFFFVDFLSSHWVSNEISIVFTTFPNNKPNDLSHGNGNDFIFAYQ